MSAHILTELWCDSTADGSACPVAFTRDAIGQQATRVEAARQGWTQPKRGRDLCPRHAQEAKA